MKILSAEQIRRWDEFTIAEERISSIDLMERAATLCTNWIIKQGIAKGDVKIVCGKGNNGGDGLAIARQLAEYNIFADVFILEFGALGTADFQINLHRLHQTSCKIVFIQDKSSFPLIHESDLIIDALYGTGVSRPLNGLSENLVRYINETSATIVSIDLPSGLFADRSTLPNAVIKAHYTLTFQTLKLCFLLPENEDFTGEVVVLDIGLSSTFLTTAKTTFELVDRAEIKNIYRPRKLYSHKGTFGHALIIGGEKGKMGAVVLSSVASAKAGAGLVTACVPEDEMPIIQSGFPEAMAMQFSHLNKVSWNKYQSVAIGPGLGTSKVALSVLEMVLKNFKKPMVIDADALNLIAENKKLLSSIPQGAILTPHPKEFERLFGATTNHFERLQLAISKAAELKIFIVLKGYHSFIACPEKPYYFNSTGNPGMATGGSGDVLTGILAGLLAQGYTSHHAVIFGVYLHGLAGDIAAEQLSQEALLASDINDCIGKSYLQIIK